jgi:hypothetical protein
MPYTFTRTFTPTYSYRSTATETANSFGIKGIEWSGSPEIQVNEPSTHNFRVGFIQIITGTQYEITYRQSVGTYAFAGGTPVCDCDPPGDAPWYEPSWCVDFTGPQNGLRITPRLEDSPRVKNISWRRDGVPMPAPYVATTPEPDYVTHFKRQQDFRTWLVVWDRTTNSLQEILYGFRYTLHQEADVFVTAAVGSRVKFRPSHIPARVNPLETPYTRIHPNAFVARGANNDGAFTFVARR